MADKDKVTYYLPNNSFSDLYFKYHEPDLEISINGEKIKVHKIVLILYSPIFKTQLLECKENDIITVDKCSLKTFKFLMDILSNAKSKEDIDNDIHLDQYIELINVANYYGIDELLGILDKEFDDFSELTSQEIYSIWKDVEYKPI